MLPFLVAGAFAAIVATPASAIVGGQRANPASYPWYAELPFCGGTLIAPDRVATAAHCVAGLPLRDVGDIRIGGRVIRHASGISIQRDYLRRALDGSDNRDAPADDVALVLLDVPVTDATPLKLRSKAPKPGSSTLLLGGGQKRVPRKPVRASSNYEPLHRATLAVISDGSCGDFYRRHGGKTYRSALRPNGMLCASDPDGRTPFRSACTGDSGGPLVAGSTLAGIVSWGLRCGGDKDPTVFTDPAAHRGFLTAARPVIGPVSNGAAAILTGQPKVGATLTCQSPPWIRQPDWITFAFDSYRFNQGRETRQQGTSTTYVVRSQDAGRLVSCVATGSNGGGFETTKPSGSLRIAGS
jgi:hypothetical protein